MIDAERTQRHAPTARLVAAARGCFLDKGVSRTRMDDIATAAGMTRQNVYRHVSGRDELVELAIVECLREFASELRARVPASPSDLRTAWLDHTIGAVLMGRESAEFVTLTGAMSRLQLNLLVGGPAVQPTVRDSFDPLLKATRLADRLRTDVSEDEMIEWIQGQLTFLAPRIDLDTARMRHMLDRFVLPVILRDP